MNIWNRARLRVQHYFGTQQPLRGRIHKISKVASGETSLVLRFGAEEPRAWDLKQGALITIVEEGAVLEPGERITALAAPATEAVAPKLGVGAERQMEAGRTYEVPPLDGEIKVVDLVIPSEARKP